ncbi:hypothetical protein ABRF32_003862 [Salmonella enterica]
MRASQVMARGQQFYGGTALYFALFCEVASRDEQTIEAFWASIARFWGTWYRRQDYYSQINQLRGVLGLESANGLSEAHAVGIYSRVAVFQDESGQQGLSQVLLTLRTENTRALPVGVFEQFELPYCIGNILTPDPGFGSTYVGQLNLLTMGFRFREESCSLHCYTVEDDRIGATQTLTEVAEALVSNVDAPLRAYASTIPLTSR